jgi:hypothetical protein
MKKILYTAIILLAAGLLAWAGNAKSAPVSSNGKAEYKTGMKDSDVLHLLGKPEEVMKWNGPSGAKEKWYYPFQNQVFYFHNSTLDSTRILFPEFHNSFAKFEMPGC